jgi:hypothetical protein
MRIVLAILLGLGLTGCFTVPEALPLREGNETSPATPKYQACAAMPDPLPTIRTPEAVSTRERELDRLYRDCAERLRVVVNEYRNLRPGG